IRRLHSEGFIHPVARGQYAPRTRRCQSPDGPAAGNCPDPFSRSHLQARVRTVPRIPLRVIKFLIIPMCLPILSGSLSAQPLTIISSHTGWVGSVDFSPDGKILASAGADQVVILTDIATGRTRATLRGHGTYISCVRFAP